MKELLTKIDDQLFRLSRAKANNVLVAQETERTKNVLFNNAAEILEAIRVAAEAEDKIKLLETELDDAERELDALTKKTTPKKTAKESADE